MSLVSTGGPISGVVVENFSEAQISLQQSGDLILVRNMDGTKEIVY